MFVDLSVLNKNRRHKVTKSRLPSLFSSVFSGYEIGSLCFSPVGTKVVLVHCFSVFTTIDLVILWSRIKFPYCVRTDLRPRDCVDSGASGTSDTGECKLLTYGLCNENEWIRSGILRERRIMRDRQTLDSL